MEDPTIHEGFPIITRFTRDNQLTERVEGVGSLFLTLLLSLAAILFYKLIMKYVAWRPIPELSGQHAGVEAVRGIITGAIFYTYYCSARRLLLPMGCCCRSGFYSHDVH